jgi:hypothetical protein
MYEDKNKKPGGGKKIEGSYKKKGAAESVKQEKKDLNKMPGDVKQMDTPPARKKGGAKKKGSADYDTSGVKGSHDHPHGGAGRMGFTQNFGAARQNSYAQGAARVAQIMGKGAFKKKGAADSGHGANPGHAHDRYISPERLDSNIQGTTSADMGMDLNEVVVSANSNTRKKKTKKKFKNTKVGKGLNAVGNFLNPSVPVYSRNKGKIVRTGVRTKLFGRQSMFTNLF